MFITNLQQVCNEVNGLGGDFLPGFGRIHEGSVLDLLPYVFILVERERAGKTHLKDGLANIVTVV